MSQVRFSLPSREMLITRYWSLITQKGNKKPWARGKELPRLGFNFT